MAEVTSEEVVAEMFRQLQEVSENCKANNCMFSLRNPESTLTFLGDQERAHYAESLGMDWHNITMLHGLAVGLAICGDMIITLINQYGQSYQIDLLIHSMCVPLHGLKP